MKARATLIDIARIESAGYRVERYPDAWGKPSDAGWALRDPEGAYLMVGDHGHLSPTQWEAVAEGLHRIEQDQR